MFTTGDIIDRKFKVLGLCSNAGGMGTILFVEDLSDITSIEKLVLKYCKENSQEGLQRFKREVRILGNFSENSKVIQIENSNLDFEPPYFVMKYYSNGDLTKLSLKEPEIQEKIFIQMLDSIQELHSQNIYHRDIKPQNFLLDDNFNVIVSDFGLTTEISSSTAFTRSSMYWGTEGYLPPEFFNGGFKHADAAGDIFTIGKSIYNLLTKDNPTYFIKDRVHPAIYHIIQRCCQIDKSMRYKSISDLKQALVTAYDVICNRRDNLSIAINLLDKIKNHVITNQYDPPTLIEFVDRLSMLNTKDKSKICFDLGVDEFIILSQKYTDGIIDSLLKSYNEMVEAKEYGWSFAETIANNMSVLFQSHETTNEQKSEALKIAINASLYMNRFAAMDTCKEMIKSVDNDTLGLSIAEIIHEHKESFIKDIEASECKSSIIQRKVREIKK